LETNNDKREWQGRRAEAETICANGTAIEPATDRIHRSTKETYVGLGGKTTICKYSLS